MSAVPVYRFAMRFSETHFSKRSLAVAIWTFTAGWLAFASSSLPAGSTLSLVLLVVTACSVGLLLGIDERLPKTSSQPRSVLIPFAASLSVALLGAMIVGSNAPAAELVIIAGVALVPVSVIGIVATWQNAQQRRMGDGPAIRKSSIDAPTQTPAYVLAKDDAGSFGHSTSVLDDDPDEDSESILGFDPIDFDSPSAADMTQWQTRSRSVTGESIEGGIRIEFAEGQREVTVHISFCPPLARCPELMTEDIDGADLEIRVAASYPFGARLSVRRPLRSNQRTQRSPSESCRIGYVAISESIQRAA